MTKNIRPSPNPGWKLGQKIQSPVDEMEYRDFSALSHADRYRLIIGAVVPRPIAFVSSMSPEGVGNLAPFSFFNAVSSNPPCLVISLTRRPDGSKKDTLVNIERTGEFVVNTVSEWMVEPMNHCSADYPHGVDEMQKVGLTPLDSMTVKPKRVKESPVHIECVLQQTVEIGDGTVGSATLVIARIQAMHVHKPALIGGKIEISEIRPVSRLAGAFYGLPPEIFEIQRPIL